MKKQSVFIISSYFDSALNTYFTILKLLYSKMPISYDFETLNCEQKFATKALYKSISFKNYKHNFVFSVICNKFCCLKKSIYLIK